MATSSGVPIGERLIEFAHWKTRYQHALVRLAAEFESSDEWVGWPTAAHWIASQLDIAVVTAREWIRIGKRLGSLPLIESALEGGALSYSKAKELTRLATPENEGELLGIAARTPAGALSRALAAWSMRNEPDDVRDQRHQRERRFSMHVEPDGAVVGHFRLPPDAGSRLRAAIDAMVLQNCTSSVAAPLTTALADDAPAGARDTPPDTLPSLTQQRADALVRAVTNGGSGVDTEVVVHVRGDGVTFDDGTPVAESAVVEMLGSSWVSAMIHDAESRPINASGRQRFPTRRQRRIVRERDRTCRDCGGEDLLQFDHVPDYATTGRTVIDELELRCAPCHRRRHREANGSDYVNDSSTASAQRVPE